MMAEVWDSSEDEDGNWLQCQSCITRAGSPSGPGPQKPFETFPVMGSLLTRAPTSIPALYSTGGGRDDAASMASYFCRCDSFCPGVGVGGDEAAADPDAPNIFPGTPRVLQELRLGG